ncbi:MAG TPA: ATP-binding protein [Burkholderiaceae bacterium]|nr:ATP-binding protein [Burkholderiaceae bacterium]
MGMLLRNHHRVWPGAADAASTAAPDRFYRRLSQAVVAGYLCTAIGICAAAALFALHNRDERIEAATAQALTLTRALDEHVRRALSGVDVVLGIVAADMVARGGVDGQVELDLHRELQRRVALLPQAASMFIYRSDLQLHAGSGFYPVPRVDGTKLMHVNTHLNPASTTLLVGKPLMSPVAKRMTIPVTRRISGANGSLVGVVGAIIDPNHFDAFYRELDLPPGVGLALVRNTGELLFRFPQLADVGPGTDISKTSPVFAMAMPLPQPVTLRYASPRDGIERFITFRSVGELGVMVAVSHEAPALLAPWRRDAIALAVGVAGVLLALSLLLWVALVQIRRRAADERAHSDTLETRVRERTAALEAANEELEAFSYSASHDLRSPLHAMSGLMFVLRRDSGSMLSAKAVDMLEKGAASVSTMTQLIDDLIDLSRSSRQAIAAQQVDLSALAHEMADALAQQHPGHRGRVQIAPGLTAQADPGLMRIVLHNLLSNAFKYSSQTEAAHIEVGSEGGDGSQVFYVRDNGAGFDMTQSHRLFKPFQRLHKRSDFSGSGIGLATAARIVRRHGGRIWAEGAPGQGATFRFTLPEAVALTSQPLAASSGAR